MGGSGGCLWSNLQEKITNARQSGYLVRFPSNLSGLIYGRCQRVVSVRFPSNSSDKPHSSTKQKVRRSVLAWDFRNWVEIIDRSLDHDRKINPQSLIQLIQFGHSVGPDLTVVATQQRFDPDSYIYRFCPSLVGQIPDPEILTPITLINYAFSRLKTPPIFGSASPDIH